MKENLYNIFQLILAILLIFVVLLQQKGGGLGSAFGGSSNVYSTKRGVDKLLHYTTIVLGVLFFGLSLARLIF
jgi:preprotein translocase subunit SecG